MPQGDRSHKFLVASNEGTSYTFYQIVVETHPWVAEAILGAALSISSTLRSWATSCVVDVCRVGPGEKV